MLSLSLPSSSSSSSSSPSSPLSFSPSPPNYDHHDHPHHDHHHHHFLHHHQIMTIIMTILIITIIIITTTTIYLFSSTRQSSIRKPHLPLCHIYFFPTAKLYNRKNNPDVGVPLQKYPSSTKPLPRNKSGARGLNKPRSPLRANSLLVSTTKSRSPSRNILNKFSE